MKQLRKVSTSNVIFLDIETARVVDHLEEGTPLHHSWEYKFGRVAKEEGFDLFEKFRERAGLYAEFARVVCITVGRIVGEEKVVLKTYQDSDEKVLLESFTKDLDMVCRKKPDSQICGHSVIEFDIPFIFKRCLVNQVIPSNLIDVGGLKPWDVTALDTKNLWKGSGRFPSALVCVCVALGVDSPKSDIDGSEVGNVYWAEGQDGLMRIVKYCERDVLALANVFRVCRFEPQIHEIEVLFVEPSAPENLMERVLRTGNVSDFDMKEIMVKCKGLTYEEKEALIVTLKGALAVTKSELSEDLEIKILSSI